MQTTATAAACLNTVADTLAARQAQGGQGEIARLRDALDAAIVALAAAEIGVAALEEENAQLRAELAQLRGGVACYTA